MEPWQEEDLRQLRLAARRLRLPRCACCDEPVATEVFLDLTPFGLQGVACERCVGVHTGCTDDLISSY